ncbi:protein Daple-like [Mytilus californianus]|uniref:protein Daple-like n=1 Tax=Mytilus californianus TaxID=6549 RepID=UPI002247423E|nr:protein Daple-like [Mytilus californianus]
MSESKSKKREKASDAIFSGTVNSSDFENPDLHNEVKNIFERKDLQPLFKQLVKVGVSEALQEHDARVKRLENEIGDKNLEIRELLHKKSILEVELGALKGNIEDNRHKIQSKIDRLKKEIDEKKKEVTSLNQELKREKKSSEERDTKVAQLEKEKDQLKAAKQQALSQRNVAIKKLNDLKQK